MDQNEVIELAAKMNMNLSFWNSFTKKEPDNMVVYDCNGNIENILNSQSTFEVSV